MSLVSEAFEAMTTMKLGADDTFLPLVTTAETDLKALLNDPDSYIYLGIAGCNSYEVVKAKLSSGNVSISRGEGGTTPVCHALGARVFAPSPLLVATMKDLICNYDCCEQGEVEPVKIVGRVIPLAELGEEWNGYVMFSGTPQITAAVDNAPSWMNGVFENNTIHLSGIPDGLGTFQVNVAGTNGNGKYLVSESELIKVVSV